MCWQAQHLDARYVHLIQEGVVVGMGLVSIQNDQVCLVKETQLPQTLNNSLLIHPLSLTLTIASFALVLYSALSLVPSWMIIGGAFNPIALAMTIAVVVSPFSFATMTFGLLPL